MELLKFDVTLTQTDLKRFIFSKLKSQAAELLVSPILYLILVVFFAIVSFWVKLNMIVFFVVLIMFIVGCLPAYRSFIACKKVFNQGEGLVGKERRFFVNRCYIQIFCDEGSSFCGQYFFYDLKNFKHDSSHFFLMFSKNIYIIIPIRCLSLNQSETLLSILKKATD